MKKYPFTKYGFTQFSKRDAEKLLTENGFFIVNTSENIESDFDLNGQLVNMENVVVVAGKI